MQNSSREYEARVLVNGSPATEVLHEGLTYLEGRAGTSYALSFKNKTNRRVMIIPSVDGLDVITGKPCGISSSGYVVNAHSTLVIPGWVVDTDTNARFTFRRQDEVRESKMTYVEATGEGGEENQGVIGFLVFPEKRRIRPRVRRVKSFAKQDNSLRSKSSCGAGGESRGRASSGSPLDMDFMSQSNDGYRGIAPTIGESYGSSDNTLSAAPCSSTSDSWGGDVEVRTSVSINHVSPAVDNDRSLGTGFGDPVAFHTQEVQFEAEDRENPAAIFIFMYDNLKNLKRVGVPVDKFTKRYEKPRVYEGPNPFPQSPRLTEESGCRPPAGWNTRHYRRGK